MENKRELRKIMKAPKYLKVLCIIMGVLFVVSMTIFLYEKYTISKVEPVEMSYELTQGTYAYVDVVFMSTSIGYVTDDENNAYYEVLDDENRSFVLGMDDRNYKKMADIVDYTYGEIPDEMAPEPMRIYGVVKELDEDDVKSMAHGVYRVTEEEFYDFVGYNMLNSRLSPTNTVASASSMLAMVFGFFFFLNTMLVGSYVSRIKKTVKRLVKNNEIYKIVSEYNYYNVEKYDKLHINLTENYVIGTESGVAVSYQSIIWIYTEIQQIYFFNIGKTLVLCTLDNKKYILANDTRKGMIDTIANQIARRCDNVMFGYSVDNSKEYRLRIKEYNARVRF